MYVAISIFFFPSKFVLFLKITLLELILLIIQFQIGFCPQFDALLEYLTVQEHLELYARIKGVSDHKIDDVCFHLKLIVFLIIL